MSSRHKRRFRRDGEPGKFVKLESYMLRCEAYRSMKALPRGVYTELRRRFNGRNNGEILLSIREIVHELHCSKDSATAALRELEEKGFIKCAQRGSFHYKIRHAPKWILTEEGWNGELASKDFMRWRAPEKNVGPQMRTIGPIPSTADENKDRLKDRTVPQKGPKRFGESNSRS